MDKIINYNNLGHYSDEDLDNFTPYSKAIRERMSKSVNIAKGLYSNGCTSNGRTFNVTFAYRKSKLLSIGINNYNKLIKYIHQFNTVYKMAGEKSYKPCLHGEISCLLKLGYEDCWDIDFFSVRINKNKKCCCSKPCLNCEAILRQVGFKHVWYFDKNMEMKSLQF